MIRYTLYDPVGKRYSSIQWKNMSEVNSYLLRMIELYNPVKWSGAKLQRKYALKQKYYKRLVVKKANIKWKVLDDQ